MTKRTLFKIVTESFPDGLEIQVQELLDKGWNTVGSLCVSQGRLYIAMEKQVDPEEEIECDTTMTQQHPDAKKLGATND